MKKLFLVAAMMVATIAAKAQGEVGSIMLQPKVGMTIASTSGDDVKAKVGLIAGVNAEYQIAEPFSVTAGVLYSMEGCKEDVSDGESIKMDYLNIPVLANYYVIKGLAVKAGVQFGFLMSAKYGDHDYKDYCEKFNFSIPVGLSYEYQNFVLDGRYNIGLSDIYKGEGESVKTHTFMITIGYKFAL